MSHYYLLYGLAVESDLSVVGAPTARGGSDWQPQVVVRVGRPFEPLSWDAATSFFTWPEVGPNGKPSFVIHYLARRGWYRWTHCDDIVFYVHESGREVWVHWPAGESAQSVVFYLVGPILGFVLRLQDSIALHGSAVSLNGQAVAILGNSGAGKSTLAAALSKRGHGVFTDDLVLLQAHNDHFLVVPGYSRIRLWPDSAKALCGNADHLHRLVDSSVLWPDWDKRALELSVETGQFEDIPRPLTAVFILGPRTDSPPYVENLTGPQGVIELVRHIYQGYLSDIVRKAKELDVLARLADWISVKRLYLNYDFRQLGKACDLLLDELGKE